MVITHLFLRSQLIILQLFYYGLVISTIRIHRKLYKPSMLHLDYLEWYDPRPLANQSNARNSQVVNASTTLMCLVKFWVTTNVALSTPISKYVYYTNSKLLVLFPYLIGTPFLFVILLRSTLSNSPIVLLILSKLSQNHLSYFERLFTQV